jgi:hypothetical protein
MGFIIFLFYDKEGVRGAYCVPTRFCHVEISSEYVPTHNPDIKDTSNYLITNHIHGYEYKSYFFELILVLPYRRLFCFYLFLLLPYVHITILILNLDCSLIENCYSDIPIL